MSQQPYEYVPQQQYPRPHVRFDAIPEAWGLLQQQMGTWVVASLLMLAIPLAIYAAWFVFISIVAGGFGGPPQKGEPSGAVLTVLLISSFVMMLAMWLVSTLTMGGLFRMAIRQVRGEPISAGDIFSATDALPSLLGASIVVGFAVMGGLLLCIVGAYVIQGMLMLTHPLIVDQRMRAMEAIGRSWDALREEMLMVTLFHFVLGVVASLGMMLCGVGILFTFPLFPLGIAVVYRDFFIGPGFPASAYAPPPTAPPPPPPTPGEAQAG